MHRFTTRLRRERQKPNDHFCWSKYFYISNWNFRYRFLQEVGYEDIFNTDEVNEIKELYDKAQAELSENLN